MRRVAVILTMLTIVFIGFGCIIPVLPLMVAGTGARPFHLGLMLAVYSAVGFFISPWWGRLSDKVGRKPVLITGLLGFAVGFIVFGLAQHMLWLMYVARIVAGGFSGAVTATAMAYIADVTGVEQRTRGMAFAGMAIGFGFIIGPAFGGLLSRWGVAVPFYAAGVLAILNALWGLAALRESLTPERRGQAAAANTSRWAAFAGPLKYLYLVDFVSQFCISSLEGVLQYFEMVKIHATAFDIGMMFLISGIVGAAVQGGIVSFIKHGKELPAMVAGLVISGIGLWLILLSRNFWTAALYMTIFGASNTVIKPTLQSVVTKKTRVGQGLASGLISAMDNLARIVGPILATVLYQVHIGLPFIVAGAVAILATALVYAYWVGAQREPAPVSAG